ncbi:MAG: zinc ribbon domain-containing protein [Phycisphaerae bacterium]|nr:zinc ribbon domain-containing protein [Phycisphaerae bacterium]
MPTYEYECRTCGETFDVFQSIKASPMRRAQCPACGGVRPVRRLVGTGGAILFKGSGFYETDYRSESYKKAAKAESGTVAKTSSDDGKSSDKGSSPGPSETAAAKKPSPKTATTNTS